jgi:pimeloyl-ACP methyl ester carboxylesterase
MCPSPKHHSTSNARDLAKIIVREVSPMSGTISRRNLLQICGGAAALGLSAVAGELTPVRAFGQSTPVGSVKDDYKEDLFYREDWLGEPWRNPDTVVLIHGNDESSVQWYGWVPRMAQQYRLIRPDLPGLGHSRVPAGFEYSLDVGHVRNARDGQGRC